MRFHFGDCVLDADRRELRRAGGPVAVEPQVFDPLLHLVRNRERVVPKDDLLEAVWNGYAALHPDRVSRLVLLGAYAQGRNRRGSEDEREMARAFAAMIRRGWGDEHSALMHAYYSLYYPGAAPEQLRGWAEMQRLSASPEDAMRIRLACDDIDVLDLLPRVRAPTLVLHCRGDNVVPLDQGRRIAAAIHGARLVVLESDNHVVFPGEPEWPRFTDEVEGFLSA